LQSTLNGLSNPEKQTLTLSISSGAQRRPLHAVVGWRMRYLSDISADKDERANAN
jgi:hypothetical protein